MIGEPLAILALGAEAVALPRLAQFAPGATIARAASFMMHGTQPFSSPAGGEGGEIGPDTTGSKGPRTDTLHLKARLATSVRSPPRVASNVNRKAGITSEN